MDGLFVVDSDRNITLINEDGARLLDLDADDLTLSAIEKTFDLLSMAGEVIPCADWPSTLALHGTFVKDFECKAKRKDTGQITALQISTSPIRTVAGGPSQFVIVCRDITERDHLDASRGLAAAIIECSDDAIVTKDTHGTVTSWNNGATKIFGYTAKEMLGQSVERLLPPELLDEETDMLDRIKRGETVDHIESVRLRKDGQPIHVSLTTSPIMNAGGAIIGVSKVARDITISKQFERNRLQSQKLESIGQLAGGVAHDFNNVLAIVLGSLELQHSSIRGNAEALQRWGAAHKAALRGVDLTRRLLTFSSMKQFTFKPTKFNHSVRNAAELAIPLLGPRVKIVMNLAEGMPDVQTDQSSLETVLLNLMVNARDAMAKGGTITVTTNICRIAEKKDDSPDRDLKFGDYACILVSDTGAGMSPAVLEHAFDPFFTTKARGKGTGLGLSMAYEFAKQSEGGLSIQSEVGRGTTVRLLLPFSPVSVNSPQASSIVASRKVMSGDILIVDDEDGLVSIIAFYLEALGYKTMRANDAAEALHLASGPGNIDVMLTDILLTGELDGMELGRAVQKLRPAMSVIYSSGLSGDALSERTKAYVDCQFLQKPYLLAELAGAVDRAMVEMRSRRALCSPESPQKRIEARNLVDGSLHDGHIDRLYHHSA